MTELLTADVVVVGGGSAGCVLAARLSADPARTVLLIEAGPAPATWPPALLDPHTLPIGAGSEWAHHYSVALTGQRAGVIARGRVLGGSGAVNGAYFMRGLPADFARWGSDLWTYDAVLPYFRALESDHDFADEYHGGVGPMPVRRQTTEQLTRISAEFADAAVRSGFADVADKNNPVSDGVGPVPLNVDDRGRVNTALAYLGERRTNLRILDRTTAHRLLFAHGAAIGVEVERDGTLATIGADRIVLSAGAIETPALLLRSGVGDPLASRSLGIPVVHELTGVGARFWDHPEVNLPYVDAAQEAVKVPILQVVLNVDDIEIRPYTAPFGVGVTHMRPEARGTVRLRSADPQIPPVVSYNYLATARDRNTMRKAVDVAGALLAVDIDSTDEWLVDHLGTSQHTAGTCRMGPASEGESVVDDRCRVHGLDGLSIVDASIIPSPISRGIHATVVMLAERAVEFLG
ncbi:mycofactocin system GMC family oxidoreductase MftG [Antrihabitans sp. YC2-6]|uniref:mycofactocin dehydrogenase MftG n=1 Tax=Antrihabitans sp. YC2-6 TaxID=2799498 RepID=UPI0018F79B63|nr:mycofactocin system GMC family oxidoreductase MftG [Antrihabitans sp. YC2-6]MBJ8348020.1 mycofactocin system GMC family oxidoreductase MftG [Antrihabitans sp. YC2-6]